MIKRHKQPSVIKNYIYNLSYQLLASVLPLITTPYISRVLKAEAIGAYSYCNSITTYFALFGAFGLNMYGQLEISKSRSDKHDVTVTFWGVFLAKSIISVIVIIAYYGMTFASKRNSILFSALSIMLFANIIDISWLFQGLEQFNRIVLRNYIIKIISVILIFIFVRTPEDVVLYAIILQGSTFFANITLWLSLKSIITKISYKEIMIWTHVKRSLSYFIPTIASSIYTVLDKSMLGWILNSDFENGVYEQAHKIELTALTIVSSLSTVMLPRMSYLFSQGKFAESREYINKLLGFLGIVAIPMSLGMIATSETFIPLFLGAGFEKCIPLLRIFSFLTLFSGANIILGNQCLVAQGKQKEYNIGVIIGAIANFGLNAFLIPRLLSVGAAIASVVAEVIIFVIFIGYSKELVSFRILFKYWYKSLISASIMAIVVILTSNFLGSRMSSLFLQIIIGIIMYFSIMLALKDNTLISTIYILQCKVKLRTNNNR